MCVTCGESFRGRYRKCLRCRLTERICPDCGGTYAGDQYKCRRCRMTPRACKRCGNTFRGDMRICATCYATDRMCPGCGRTFHSMSTECLSCSGRANVINGRRRARKAAAEVAGPVPRAVYLAVRKSGPCVYCGAPATTVDHIRPLSRHGHEAPYNLVPACRRCNYGKRNRLLTGWDPVRVAHAAAHSPLVAAELKRLADGDLGTTPGDLIGRLRARQLREW